MSFLWGIQPIIPTHETFFWGVQPVSPVGTYRILGHRFNVTLANSGKIGHSFTILPRAVKVEDIQQKDADKFTEQLSIERQEPEQLKVEPVVNEPVDTKQTEAQRVENAVNNLKEWLVAASQMQKVLESRLQDRQIKVNPKNNPAVRDAIRRLFGKDSNTITYDMFQQALKWRSELVKDRRQDTYGTDS